MKIAFVLLASVMVASASDIRIVNNIHVDIQPVHDWFETHGGKRPMPHWKQIKIMDFVGGGPWPTCTINAEGATKKVYLKNLPASAMQYWTQLGDLKTRVSNLKQTISTDKKRLRSADTVDAEYGSEYYQNRERFRVNLENNEDDLDNLETQLAELEAHQKEMISDFAMFTGQVYNRMEVWDCGMKTQ